MECAHPDFDADPDPYAGHIITYDNVRGKIPEKCPLRTADVTIKRKVTKQPHHGAPKVIDKMETTYSLLNEAEAELVKTKWTETQYLHLNGLDGGCGR
jgi:hypothetical protein